MSIFEKKQELSGTGPKKNPKSCILSIVITVLTDVLSFDDYLVKGIKIIQTFVYKNKLLCQWHHLSING